MKTNRICAGCNQDKPIDQYYGQYYPRCKPCHSAFVKANQKAKVEHYSAYRKEYGKQHPEKVKAWTETYIKRWEAATGLNYKQEMAKKVVSKMSPERLERKKQYQQKYAQLNRERIKKNRRVHYLSHRDELIKKSIENYKRRKSNGSN